jgi:hypothetical protein
MALLGRIETRLTQSLDGLPKSDRGDIGAGYAMAGAAAVAATVFGAVQGLITPMGMGVFFILTWGVSTHLLALDWFAVAAAVGWLLAVGMSIFLVFPSGFIGGVVVWRFVPESPRLGGLVGGLLSTLVGYVVSCRRTRKLSRTTSTELTEPNSIPCPTIRAFGTLETLCLEPQV